MPSQPILRPFDIAVALRLLLVPEDRYEPLADALVTSTSAVHRSVARLGLSGICRPSSRTVNRDALHEFLLHGVRFAFPPMIGPERTGVPTSVAHPQVLELLSNDSDARPMVWPSDLGKQQAASIAPLFSGVPAVATRDPRLHELLAVVDVLRTGGARERKRIGEWLADGVLSTKA